MNKNVLFETLNAIRFFADDIQEMFVLNIPHGSTYIPYPEDYLVSQEHLQQEINSLTDWGVNEIFDIKNVRRVITPVSRFFCDTERFLDDEIESMSGKGMGWFYTHASSGQELRLPQHKDCAMTFYKQHHKLLEEAVEDSLRKYGVSYIIDAHTFSDNKKEWADICLGTDSFHTPEWLYNLAELSFKKEGYTVKRNEPFEGTIVPEKFFLSDKKVSSIMMEINKNLFLNNNYSLNQNEVSKLNNIISRITDLEIP